MLLLAAIIVAAGAIWEQTSQPALLGTCAGLLPSIAGSAETDPLTTGRVSYLRCSSTILPSCQRAIVENTKSKDLPVASMKVPSGCLSGAVNVPVNDVTEAVWSPSPNSRSYVCLTLLSGNAAQNRSVVSWPA